MFGLQRPKRGHGAMAREGGRPMAHDEIGKAQLIRIEVEQEGEQLLVATSPDMPDFLVLTISREDLEREVPAAIRKVYKLRHGQDVELIELKTKDTVHPV